MLSLGFALLTFGITSCHPVSNPNTAAPKEPPPLPVLLSEARPDPVTAAEDVPGTLRPVESAVLSSKVSGTITEIDADPGRIVREGDLLLRIDDREIRARLDHSRAMLEQAERDLSRFEKLHTDRVITTQEYEAAQTRHLSARASEEEARTLLGYTNILAPFDGVVTRRLVQRGDLAVPGRALVEVENPGRLRLEAQVPESLISGISIGQKIIVAVGAGNANLTGLAAEIAPASDPASRTTLVKIDLPTSPDLRSGQFGRARIPTDTEPSIRLPKTAVSTRGQLDFVFVVSNGRAKLRIVRTGRQDEGFLEILSGLDPGEIVVAEIPAGLSDGHPVIARTEESGAGVP